MADPARTKPFHRMSQNENRDEWGPMVLEHSWNFPALAALVSLKRLWTPSLAASLRPSFCLRVWRGRKN